MPSTLEFGTPSDYRNASRILDALKQRVAAGMESVPWPSVGREAPPEGEIRATPAEVDPGGLMAPVVMAGPQDYAQALIRQIKADPRRARAFDKIFAKQELISEAGNPVMGFHGRTKDFPLENIRGTDRFAAPLDQMVGSHWATDPEIASHFATRKGMTVFHDPQSRAYQNERLSKFLQQQGQLFDQDLEDLQRAMQGNVVPAFIKSENPHIIRQVKNSSTKLRPTPWVSRGMDINPKNILKHNGQDIVEDSTAIDKDFFDIMFNEATPPVIAGRNADWWIRDMHELPLEKPEFYQELSKQGKLGDYIKQTYPIVGEANLRPWARRYKDRLKMMDKDSIVYMNTQEAPGELDPRTIIPLDRSNIISPFDFSKLITMGSR